jgi:hypothetical protein
MRCKGWRKTGETKMATQVIYKQIPAGIVRVELRRSIKGTAFTKETLLLKGTREYRRALEQHFKGE